MAPFTRSTCHIPTLLLQGALLLLANPVFSLNLIVIGDSTASNYTRLPSSYPQAGWAMFLGDHFNQSSAITVRDAAVAGRSSKSFYEEKLWQLTQSRYQLSAGDYVFIQFGHNDQVHHYPERYTDPFTTYQHYLSIYVNDTRAADANPVLLTPISRAVWQDGVLQQTLGDYPAAVRQLASQLSVPLIDMNAETTALFNRLGAQATRNNLFMCLTAGTYPNYPDGISDTTHLQVAGAKQVAALAAQGIVDAKLPIAAYVQ
ncbi:hypothetical protein L7F22_014384 [Adiantum nelumboides]|nr:hypothetical protein [Adiantum nelumboides]